MVRYKKIDDKDFVFLNEPTLEAEEKAFSEFIQQKKLKKYPKQKAIIKKSTAKKDK